MEIPFDVRVGSVVVVKKNVWTCSEVESIFVWVSF